MQKLFYLFTVLSVFLISPFVAAKAVKEVKITGDHTKTRVILECSEDFSIHLKENATGFSLLFPSSVDIIPNKGTQKGLIQKYEVSDHTIHFSVAPGAIIDKSFSVGSESGASRYILDLVPSAQYKEIPRQDPSKEEGADSKVHSLEVQGIRTSNNSKASRIVFDLSEPEEFHVQHDLDNGFVKLETDKNLKMPTGVNNATQHVEYIVHAQESPGVILIKLRQGAKVSRTFSLNTQDQSPRFVIDLEPGEVNPKTGMMIPTSNISSNTAQNKNIQKQTGVESAKHMSFNSIQQEENRDSMEFFLHKAEQQVNKFANNDLKHMYQDADGNNRGSGENLFDQKDLVQKIALERIDNGRTKIKIFLVHPEHFPLYENDYTNQLIVQMPQFNTRAVHFESKKEGLVNDLYFDKTETGSYNLIINLSQPGSIKEHYLKPAKNNELAHYIIIVEPVDKKHEEEKHREVLSAIQTHKAEAEEGGYRSKAPATPKLQPEFEAGDVSFADVGIGTYISGQLGFTNGEAIASLKQTSSGGVDSYRMVKSFQGLTSNMNIGYGWGIDRMYIGVEGIARLSHATGDTSFETKGALPSEKYQDLSQFTYGLNARLGFYLTPDTLLYHNLGVVGTLFQHRISEEGNALYGMGKKVTKNMGGVQLGVGLETALSDHTTLRLDYNRITYQAFSKNEKGLGRLNVDQSVSYKNSIDQFLIGFSYKFSPMFGPDQKSSQETEIPTGFYMGSGMAMTSSSFLRSFTRNNFGKLEYRSQAQAPQWDVYFGFGKQYGPIYIGGETQFQLGNRFINEKYSYEGAVETSRNDLQSSGSLSIRPGYAFGKGNLFYGRVGATAARMRHRSNSTATPRFIPQDKFSRILYGITMGAGIESFISENLSVRGEYIYDYFTRFRRDNQQQGVSQTFMPANNRFQFAMSYTF